LAALLLALLGRSGELVIMGEPGEKAFGLLAGALVKGQKHMNRCLTAMALENVALRLREGCYRF
jgi:hypothetical protein